MNYSASKTREFTLDRAFRRWGLLESQGVLAGTANTQRKRLTRIIPWMLLGVLFACVRLLAGVQCADQLKAAQGNSKTTQTQIKLNLDGRRISLEIKRCMPHDARGIVTEDASKCIADLRAFISGRSEEQKEWAHYVTIANENLECYSGCCDELVVHLVHEVAKIEELQVNQLRVGGRHSFKKTKDDRAVVFIDKPERAIVLQSLYVWNLSSACFHSVCSVVQMHPVNPSWESKVDITYISHIDFTRYPLVWPWRVDILEVEGASTVDLGLSVYRLPRKFKAKNLKTPGLWVKDKVVIYGSRNCCMPESTAKILEWRMWLKVRVGCFGIAVAESTPDTEVPQAVYRAVCAISMVDMYSKPQRYVVVPHKAYKERDPKALKELAEQLNRLFEANPKQSRHLAFSGAVGLRGAPKDRPFMHVDARESEKATGIPWVVRAEKEVVGSREACAKAAEKLEWHTPNVHVMEAIAVLRHLEEALSDPSSSGADITGGHGMTLFPCGCFEEDALNEIWHGRAQGCKGKSSGSTQYRDFPQVTLSRQADGSVHMAIPTATPLFAMAVVACDPVYEVSVAEENSINILVSKVPERICVCPGTFRRHYVSRVYPEVIDVIKSMEKDNERARHFTKIALVPAEPMSLSRWMYVCMYVLKALAKEEISPNAVEISAVQEGAEEESAVFERLLSTNLWKWVTHTVESLRTSILCVEPQIVERLPLLSWIVRTGIVLITMGGGEGIRVCLSKEDAVEANSMQSWASSPISEVITRLSECRWYLIELCVRGKHRVCVGTPEERPGPKVVQESKVCKKVVLEGEVVFESLEAVPAYFEWKKQGTVKEYPDIKVSVKDSKRVWVDDRAFGQAEDNRPRVQKYLEALMEWCPEGVHVVFQVRVSEDSEYDITRRYRFCPASNQKQWMQVCLKDWKIELEVCEYSEKTGSVVSTTYYQIHLAHKLLAQPKYRWVHVPGWAMSTGELKKKTAAVLKKLFGAVYIAGGYCAEKGELRESADTTSTSTSTPASDHDIEEECCGICLGEFNFTPMAADLSKVPTFENPGPSVTVLQCGHVYHRACFEMYLSTSPNGKTRCAMCNRAIRRDWQPVIAGRVDTLSGKKVLSEKDALEVLPDHSDSIYERVITWTVADSPREGMSVNPRTTKRKE